MPWKRIWKKLSNIFSLYDVIHSVRDLLHHKELIEQVMKQDESLKESKGKLRVYLAPFLHGMRYTSFGRHFTKVEKLKEVADKIMWLLFPINFFI
ncbi:protein ENHANCED DOWNY MILDEW 2-like isoform X2 [Amaranthus tricolor]|uniref:protein ENHANCED DOWNY MILDEW 2-like isoform X2 n=1 Tax=Amaranthus tricolor TaxID=29722 RepID=UPI00258E7AD1|nr:protein ENHANCED DOWNY MILDEW 2-like isoform X2 [Amaranthus tricolor]